MSSTTDAARLTESAIRTDTENDRSTVRSLSSTDADQYH
jgi:hypothetical protein